MTSDDLRDATAVLLLRLSLAWFIFLWAIHKILTPKQYQSLAKNFDGVEVSFAQIYTVAWVQIAVCALVALGLLRYFSYGALAVMHFYTLTRQWEGYFDPFAISKNGFPVNRNKVIALVAMAAIIAIILLIRRDHFSLGGWLRRRIGPRWWQ